MDTGTIVCSILLGLLLGTLFASAWEDCIKRQLKK